VFGRSWEPATARIVTKRYKESSGYTGTWEYVADVTPSSGGKPFRAKLKQPPMMSRVIRIDEGAEVEVLVDVARQKAKFDRAKAKTIGREAPFRKGDFDEALSQPPGTPPPPDPDSL
jgi:hypothetical protein